MTTKASEPTEPRDDSTLGRAPTNDDYSRMPEGELIATQAELIRQAQARAEAGGDVGKLPEHLTAIRMERARRERGLGGSADIELTSE